VALDPKRSRWKVIEEGRCCDLRLSCSVMQEVERCGKIREAGLVDITLCATDGTSGIRMTGFFSSQSNPTK
jgi:hypothetical protein